MIFEWLRSRRPARAPAAVPAGTRIYAIGDIHGRADLLGALLERVRADAGGWDGRRVAVLLGDYVDRGLSSREVIDTLLDDPLPGFETVFLKGNHEAWLLAALEGPDAIGEWLEAGGLATLLSYGVGVPAAGGAGERARAVSEGLRARVPAAHRAFLEDLRTHHVEGGYLFVHAGVRPGVALGEQDEADLLWIREEFLDDPSDHGYVVVHGHSVRERLDRRPNRIGIDTGAFASGRLSCLVLEGDAQRLIHT